MIDMHTKRLVGKRGWRGEGAGGTVEGIGNIGITKFFDFHFSRLILFVFIGSLSERRYIPTLGLHSKEFPPGIYWHLCSTLTENK
jgi:hypothetical protein